MGYLRSLPVNVTFYVYGSHEQEVRDSEWLGQGNGFVMIDPDTGVFVGDAMTVTLENGFSYILLQTKDLPYWLVAERDPERRTVYLQRYVRHQQSLVYLSSATRSDVHLIREIMRCSIAPWSSPVTKMEFASNEKALKLAMPRVPSANVRKAA